MRAPLDFDTATDALRRIYIFGDDLRTVAADTGHGGAELATGLHALLTELRGAVEAAVRAPRQHYRIGAHGRLDEHLDLPPGLRLVPRGHPL